MEKLYETGVPLLYMIAVAIILILVSIIIVKVDTRVRKKSKYGEKVKTIRTGWKLVSLITLAVSVTMLVISVKAIYHFDGEEFGESKVIEVNTLNLSDVAVPSGNAKLDKTLEEDLDNVLSKIQNHNKNSDSIMFTNKLKNRQEVRLYNIHNVKYTDELNNGTIQIVRYITNSKDGYFKFPQLYWYIVIGTKEVQEEDIY